MSFVPPNAAQFKAQFVRDFPYGSGLDTVTDADIQNAINEGQQLFNSNDWDTSVPQTQVQTTGDLTSGSAVIINVASISNIAVNQPISGTGIPAGAIITALTATTITVSVNATASATGETLTIGSISGYTVSEAQIGYLYLTAHLLTLSLQSAGGLGALPAYGGQGSSGGGVVQSKTVGSITVNYQLPDFVSKSPTLSQFMRTNYGQKYLQMWIPKRAGRRVMVVGAEASPGLINANAGEIWNPNTLGPAQVP
ncbi:MAG: DUF4054 domain-containing protein [Patescibacteria group bacterium]|nr:DUF4054 domain-containing protein [Patescibacteria group bacterium]